MPQFVAGDARVAPARRVPPRARPGREWTLAAGHRAPRQRLVSWLAPSYTESDSGVAGVAVWTRVRAGWRLSWAQRNRPVAGLRVQTADLTGDGHPEALVEETNGSAGCGSRRVLGFAGGSTRQVWGRWSCEAETTIRGRRLVYEVEFGECGPGHTAHCHRFRRRSVWRWNGHRLVRVSASVALTGDDR